MSSESIEEAVSRLCLASSVQASSDVIPICASYLRLLHRWNQRMNLTALPLGEVPPDASIQKLVVEPLCGAALAEGFTGDWLDLGSGGGSPVASASKAARAAAVAASRVCHAVVMRT